MPRTIERGLTAYDAFAEKGNPLCIQGSQGGHMADGIQVTIYTRDTGDGDVEILGATVYDGDTEEHVGLGYAPIITEEL